MLFIVQFEDVYADHPERLPERAQHMEAHLAFLAKHGDRVVAAGATRPTAGGTPTGGMWILNVESKAAAEALSRDDPFWQAGLRKSVVVSHWAKAFWSPTFTDCMAAIGQAMELRDHHPFTFATLTFFQAPLTASERLLN